MAPSFVFPQSLRALEEEHEDNRLYARNPLDIASLRPSELEEFVKGISFDLSDKELFCIEEQDVFDRVYSLIRGYNNLPPSCKVNLLESLRSNLSVLLPNVDSLSRVSQGQDDVTPVLDRVASHRNAFKIYTFFLLTVVLTEESNINSNNNVKKCIFSVENAALLKDTDTKDALCRIIGTCATKYQYMAQSCASIMHLVHKYDFVVTHIADAVAGAEKKHADGSLASSLIREIGRTNPKDYIKDTVGAENVGRFLVELSDRLPKLVSTNIGLIVPHFGGESYKIRNALVGVLGKLVAKAFQDVEGEVSSKSVRLRTKHAMLEILLERCRDVSAYTRSRVLQVWAELCEEHSVSIGLWNELAEVASGRLEDKSAMHNPFGPQLRIASFEATLQQYKNKLKELEPDISSESEKNRSPSDDCTTGDSEVDDADADVTKEQQDSLPDSCLPDMEQNIVQKDGSVPDVGNLEQTRALVASLEAGLRFSKCISATIPTLVQLMASSSATDVENTIHLLMRCKQFQIDASEACLRKMLPLVFSQDKSIYEAVENAFITIYIKKSPVETAKNLMNLATESNIGDLAALEFIVGALVSKGDISTGAISALWDFFCFNVSGTTAEQSRGATLLILGLVVGLMEPLLARTACIALQRLSEEDRKKLLSSNGSRVFSILESLVTGFWLPENIWYAAADKAIAAIYAIHPTPETLASNLVKKSLSSVFECSGGEELQSEITSGSAGILTTVQVAKLSRYLFVISHIAMNHLVYIESCLRKVQKQKIRKEKTDTDQHGNGTPKENGINAELGLAASEDALLDTLSEKAEKEILLFTVVESAPSEIVRSNCTISLGDLAVRFPNLLEPWTENMYSRLQDPSASVRKNAVLVLSHLILNDMMKVKGYINEMAVRLEDEDERISNLAKLFLMSYLRKDKQMEALVEKLCNRFSGVTDIRQWEYISYCLSQLAFTEKGMKKLIESFKTYEHVLSEDSVMDHFRNIINKGKKFAKPEVKMCIEEFEDKLNKLHLEKKEQEVTARNAQIHQQKISSMESFVVTSNAGDASSESDISEDGEVVDPSIEGMTKSVDEMSKSRLVESEEYSGTSSELTESEPGDIEVQSPNVNIRGPQNPKPRKATRKIKEVIFLHPQEVISGQSKGRVVQSGFG
ncbi:hypothetical protein Prudu_019079 [Prunus dulcis]|uniref:Condensin-1 complex subunit CAP-D2 n=1 Tax=Prunus dulcis TaxID=3755 RepID=A0A4Y1RSA8_PRUDU|nr:hypothetical protein Prudu_019079 [Prunus dulcis]